MTRKKRAVAGALIAVPLVLLWGSPVLRSGPQEAAQEPPPQEVQRPNYDYMGTFLSRSTSPLGIKEDPAARRMLGQGAVAWAIRAGSRHVLD